MISYFLFSYIEKWLTNIHFDASLMLCVFIPLLDDNRGRKMTEI
jgi:hypothetical protein